MAKDGVSTKQKAAIRSLLSGANYGEAAAAAKVHENTISQWMKDPNFIEALKQAENIAMAAVCRSLLSLTDKAVGVLDSVLQNPKARDSARLRAADIALGRAIQIKELADLEQRIRKLEEVYHVQE